MSNELKPCPFCGSAAKFTKRKMVVCGKGSCFAAEAFCEQEDWNTRAQPTVSGLVPDGWQLVPAKLTEAMRTAGGYINSEWLNDNAPLGQSRYTDPMVAIYNAMLAASPSAKEGDV